MMIVEILCDALKWVQWTWVKNCVI